MAFTVYTDGSAIIQGQPAETRSGYGIYYGRGNSNNLSAKLKGTDQSSARAELQAIVVALQRALRGRYSITLRSDAGSVIDVVNGRSTASANIDLVHQKKKNH
jgi:ribonuclease HI